MSRLIDSCAMVDSAAQSLLLRPPEGKEPKELNDNEIDDDRQAKLPTQCLNRLYIPPAVANLNYNESYSSSSGSVEREMPPHSNEDSQNWFVPANGDANPPMGKVIGSANPKLPRQSAAVTSIDMNSAWSLPLGVPLRGPPQLPIITKSPSISSETIIPPVQIAANACNKRKRNQDKEETFVSCEAKVYSSSSSSSSSEPSKLQTAFDTDEQLFLEAATVLATNKARKITEEDPSPVLRTDMGAAAALRPPPFALATSRVPGLS